MQTRSQTSPGQVLAIVCVGMILANLDLFIVNVGLPNIAADFHSTSLEDLSWVLNGYTITYAALLVFFGRLSERYHRNASFLLGIAAFTAASAACAVATSVDMLVAFRVVQAAAAALMTPTSLGPAAGILRAGSAGGGGAHLDRGGRRGRGVGSAGRRPAGDGQLALDLPGQRAHRRGGADHRLVEAAEDPRPRGRPAAFRCGAAGDGGRGRSSASPSSRSMIGAGIRPGSSRRWWWRRSAWACSCGNACGRTTRSSTRACSAFAPSPGRRLVMAPFSAAFGAILLSIVLWDETVWGWSALKIGLAMAPGPLLVPVVSIGFSRQLIARFGAACR